MWLVLAFAAGSVVGALLFIVGMELGRRLSRSTLQASQSVMAASKSLSVMAASISRQAAMDYRTAQHLETSMTYFQEARDRMDRLASEVVLMRQTMVEQATMSRPARLRQTEERRVVDSPPPPPRINPEGLWGHRPEEMAEAGTPAVHIARERP